MFCLGQEFLSDPVAHMLCKILVVQNVRSLRCEADIPTKVRNYVFALLDVNVDKMRRKCRVSTCYIGMNLNVGTTKCAREKNPTWV